MSNNQKTQLHRSKTYPYDIQISDKVHQYFMETSEGWYNLIIDKETDDFVLTTPEYKQLEDCLTEIHKRKDLYDQYGEDHDLYEWLYMVHDEIKRKRKINGETRAWFKIDDQKYSMRVNKKSGEVLLTMPKHTRIFTTKSMYSDFIDLVAIQDGKLDSEIRKRLQHKGFDLQKPPYMVGLSLTPKQRTRNDNR